MMNILVTLKEDSAGMQRLKALPGMHITHAQVDDDDDQYTLPAEMLREQHVLFCECPPKNIGEMQSLKFIQISSVGYSHLYNLGLVEKGVRVANALGLHDVSIAEWNLCMIIALKRDLRGMIRDQEHGIWHRADRYQQELRGATVGFWGYGGTARETARLLKAMGMKIHAFTRSGVKPRPLAWRAGDEIGDPLGTLPDRVFTGEEKMEFLRGLDFLIMSMPLTKETEGIVGDAELAALPNTACVLNPARGPLIQEAALLKALREQTIAGVALDTHYYYPMPADHPLWRFPNVIMTPHISGANANDCFLTRIWDIFVLNIERLINGRPLLNELTESQLNGG